MSGLWGLGETLVSDTFVGFVTYVAMGSIVINILILWIMVKLYTEVLKSHVIKQIGKE